MKFRNRNSFIVALLATMSVATSPVFAQDGFARQEQLQELGADLSGISARVQMSVDQTMSSMDNLANFSGSEQTDQAFAILDAIEAETREVIDKIKITSPFMSALDDARSNVLVLLRKNERDPASPSRDARIAALTNALASIDEQTVQIQAAEGTLTSLLADHAVLRAELMANGAVDAVELFVSDLSSLTNGLEQMASVLSEISANVVAVPTEASLATE
ncbi:hypothetical protein [Loktanella sp. 5RATIMAR09]|uniref:hypothetical protein n=1 Tax=Loktanella sp. 5RATIMAR09 TaxID=1225655 RepID=UPI0006EB4A01|nr:hypothetical protein [Loktanella sp. 5RATIMAR09]